MRTPKILFPIVVASALLGACGSDGTRVSSASGQGSDPPIALPKALAGEDRVLVPLGNDLDGLALKGGDVTLDAKGSVLRLPSGATIEVAPGDRASAELPPELGAAEAAGASDERATEASWATGQGTALVRSTVPIRAAFLEDYARAVVSLPRPLAEALAAGKAIEPVTQTFRLGGLSFKRTLEQTFAGSSQGLAQTLAVDIDDAKGDIVINHSDLGGDLAPAYPQEKLVFRVDGRYHWLVMAAGGLEVGVTGDDRADRISDDLTGATYLLLTDENGDDQVEVATETSGKPTISTFAPNAD
jgi:hypothetical protein